MNQWQIFIKELEIRGFYTELLMLITEVIALVIGWRYVRNQKTGRFFIFYIAFDLVILITDFYMVSRGRSFKNSNNRFAEITNTLIATAELLIYYYFFRIVLRNRTIKKVMTLLAAAFTLVMLVYLITDFEFLIQNKTHVAYVIGTLEFVFLLPPCLVFFIEIIRADSKEALPKRPSFWIVSGIFFYAFISIPYYLTQQYFVKTSLYPFLNAAFYNIPYAINFIFLTKAFLCKKPLTT